MKFIREDQKTYPSCYRLIDVSCRSIWMLQTITI